MAVSSSRPALLHYYRNPLNDMVQLLRGLQKKEQRFLLQALLRGVGKRVGTEIQQNADGFNQVNRICKKDGVGVVLLRIVLRRFLSLDLLYHGLISGI